MNMSLSKTAKHNGTPRLLHLIRNQIKMKCASLDKLMPENHKEVSRGSQR